MAEQIIHREINEYNIAYNHVTNTIIVLVHFSTFENIKFKINKVVINTDYYGRNKEVKKRIETKFSFNLN